MRFQQIALRVTGMGRQVLVGHTTRIKHQLKCQGQACVTRHQRHACGERASGAVAAYRQAVEAKGTAIAYAADNVKILGLGTVDLFAVRDPDGNLTEFYHAH